MKKIILTLIVITTLTSCVYEKTQVRARALSNGAIIRLNVPKEVMNFYRVGDTVTIHNFLGTLYERSWKIENGRHKDESSFHGGYYIYERDKDGEKVDSTYVRSYISIYKNVVIEEILDQ